MTTRALNIAVLAMTGLLPWQALAVDVGVGTNTNVNTGVSTNVDTTADSGVNIGSGARINGGVRTGNSTATSDVNTDVNTTTRSGVRTRTDADADVRARSDTRAGHEMTRANADVEVNRERAAKNRSYHNRSGKGHKYGHDKDNAENNPTR